jgi:DNA repair protein RecO (recombination protein O)
MSEEKNVGILLQAIPYLGHQRILKVFTPEEGLISLITKSTKLTALAPFCIAEWVYKKGQKEIHTLTDGTLLDGLLELRKDYATLCAAGAMAKDLLTTQFPGKKAPALYALLCAYMKKIPLSPKPDIFAASFRLKLLQHEGLLSLEQLCACGAPARQLSEGESHCTKCKPGLLFTSDEWEQLHQLAYVRQFSALPTGAPFKKIDVLFEERI